MELFKSYPLLGELLPMYDYLDHWCWLMNQLCKTTREVWSKYRHLFRFVDRATMTVLNYSGELNQDLSNLLLKSSILSCMDIFVTVKSNESIDLLFKLIGGLSQSFIVPIEIFAEVQKPMIIPTESKISSFFDSDDDFALADMIFSIVRIRSVINKSEFEYKKEMKYSEFQTMFETPLEGCEDGAPDIFKTIVSTYFNNDNNFLFDVEGGTLKILSKHQNINEMSKTLFLDSIQDVKKLNELIPKEHLTLWIQDHNLEFNLLEALRENPHQFSVLKSVTFKNDFQRVLSLNQIGKFAELGHEGSINVEFGAKEKISCYVYDKHSELYLWNSEAREFQGIRFDELIMSYSKNKSIALGNGYFCLDI